MAEKGWKGLCLVLGGIVLFLASVQAAAPAASGSPAATTDAAAGVNSQPALPSSNRDFTEDGWYSELLLQKDYEASKDISGTLTPGGNLDYCTLEDLAACLGRIAEELRLLPVAQ